MTRSHYLELTVLFVKLIARQKAEKLHKVRLVSGTDQTLNVLVKELGKLQETVHLVVQVVEARVSELPLVLYPLATAQHLVKRQHITKELHKV